MSNIWKINSIPFLEILDKLNAEYKTKWDVIYMIDWWKPTDWWRWSIREGFLKCHSWLKPWRFEWDRLNIIKSKFGIWDSEAFKWYEENFSIEKKVMEVKEVNKYKTIFNSLWELTWEQREYLMSRSILTSPNPNKYLRNDWGYISLEIKSEWWLTIWIQGRSLSDDKKNRYRIDGAWSWLFIENYSPGKKELFIVEWMTDFITANELWLNVIGLVSAATSPELLKAFHKKHTLIIISDKDDAWNKFLEKCREVWLNFGTYDVGTFWDWIKDFNDLVNNIIEIWGDLKELENIILSYAVLPLNNLQLALKKARRLKSAWTILTWDATFDKMTAWIWLGKTMLINWPSWQGKTTLSLHILRQLVKLKVPVIYYSLETDVWTQLCQILSFLNWVTVEYILNNIDNYSKQIEWLSNIELYDDIRDFEWIKAHISENKPKVAIIDFAQKVQINWANEKEKMINYAQWMQNFAIDNEVTWIITLSQTAMTNYMTPILQRMPKDSWALFESSDTTINVWRDENWKWVVAFLKTKNIWAKWWYKVCDTNYNFNTWEYIIFEPFDTIETPWKKILN